MSAWLPGEDRRTLSFHHRWSKQRPRRWTAEDRQVRVTTVKVKVTGTVMVKRTVTVTTNVSLTVTVKGDRGSDGKRDCDRDGNCVSDGDGYSDEGYDAPC